MLKKQKTPFQSTFRLLNSARRQLRRVQGCPPCSFVVSLVFVTKCVVSGTDISSEASLGSHFTMAFCRRLMCLNCFQLEVIQHPYAAVRLSVLLKRLLWFFHVSCLYWLNNTTHHCTRTLVWYSAGKKPWAFFSGVVALLSATNKSLSQDICHLIVGPTHAHAEINRSFQSTLVSL